MSVRALLAHPLTRGMAIDAPETTELRRRIIQSKGFLRRIYVDWYRDLVAAIPTGDGAIVELGSGASFLSDFIPDLVTSDLLPLSSVRLVADAEQLPFTDRSLKAIVMTQVLHHISDVRRLFTEAARCVRPGGVIAAVEPWRSAWSAFVYTRLHHEPFEADAERWEFPREGPLSTANGALPWILFERDREQFAREFPQWRLVSIETGMPFCYLLSGGVSMRALLPGFTYPLFRRLERLLPNAPMVATVVLRRVDDEGGSP